LARHLSIVLTEPIDAGALTARELVGLGRYPFTDWLGRLTAADRERIEAAIAAVGADAIADRPVRSLSDGERQRVLIARALAQEPRLVILDEPTAYLDLPRRIETLGLLRRLVRENGVSVLLSTHHLDLALSHADRVWLLPLGGPLAIGAPEDVALSGALERTFRSDRLVFDRGEGSFGLREEPARAAVVLEGDGLARRWVERALRREGLAAIDASSGAAREAGGAATEPPVIARVRIAGDPSRYLLETGGERSECASIHELVARLKSRPEAGRR
jgi:iron complex transport system ATP-binding protein